MIRNHGSLLLRGMVVCTVLVLSALRVPTALGQGAPEDSVIAALREGVAAYESGNAAAAESILVPIVRNDPAAFDPALGSGAYWLGANYWEQERRKEAIDVWDRGWDALIRRGLVDLPLGDRLVWGTFDAWDEERFEAASEVYITLLSHLEKAAGERTRRIASGILTPLRLILPDSVRAATGLTEEESAIEGRLGTGGGARLAEWWRSMDALPATTRNERLIEHLQRVTAARKRYSLDGVRGFDDRGVVYIRFGPPGRKTKTRINPFDIGQSHVNTLRGVRTVLSTGIPSFPRNEFWVYPDVDETAQFLFVQGARGGYRLGTTYDLIPSYLRGPRYSRIRLKVLEVILRDLVLYHPWTYSRWYEEVATYITDLELSDLSAQVDRLSSGIPGAGRLFLPYSPQSFVDYYMEDHRMDELRAVRDRDREIPPSKFNDFGDLAEITVAVRTARFLNADGSTRLEIYWTAPMKEFADANRRLNDVGRQSESDFLVELTFTEYDSLSRRRGDRVVRKRVTGVGPDPESEVLFPQVLVVDRIDDTRRLALQWDVLAITDSEGQSGSSRIGMALARLDAVKRLNDDRRMLEMSDLKPVLVDPVSGKAGAVFPGGVLTPQIHIGLEFEVYHLTFGSEDRTHYTVSYELEREEDLAFRTRAHQDTRSQVITASTSYRGAESTEREKIVLDLSDWSSPGQLRILVRVRDEISGQEVTRALDFDLEFGI